MKTWYVKVSVDFLNNYFQPQFALNTMLHQFQLYSKVARKPWTLQRGHLAVLSTHLAPYLVISTLLTIFFMPQFSSLRLIWSYEFVMLGPFTFYTQPPKHLPSERWQSALCICVVCWINIILLILMLTSSLKII